MRTFSAIAALLMGFGLSSTTVEAEPQCLSIAEIACSNDAFSTLCTAVTAAGLGGALSSGLWTVFAPTNDAFAALPAGTLEAVLADKILLTDILLFHVIPKRRIRAAKLECSDKIKMGNGKNSKTICRKGKKFQRGPGNTRTLKAMPELVIKNVAACNGIIHAIDNVMLP